MTNNEKFKYYSEPLKQAKLRDWFDVAKNCSYVWQDILDKELIDRYFKTAKETNFIIYNQSNLPVAIYYSNYKETC